MRVKSKWARMRPPRASIIRRRTVATAMAEDRTARNERPAAPVSEETWRKGTFECRAMPSEFQPRPVKTWPRRNSVATQAAAQSTPAARLRHELSQTERAAPCVSRGVAKTKTIAAHSAG